MSNKHLTLVRERSRARNSARLLLFALADRANEKGESWPSVETLMRDTRLSRGGVFHATKEAERLGELRVEPYKGQHHTHRYTIQILNRSDFEPFKMDTPTLQNLNINPSESEPKPKEPKEPKSTIARKKQCEQSEGGFNQFWEAYPRKASKPAAISAWRKTAKTRPPLPELLNALAKHKARWNDPKFIPHPATWINGERWNDELADRTPPRREVRVTSDIKEVRL